MSDRVDGVVFDWSGTLADDQRLTWQMTNRTLAHFGGNEVSFETYRREFTLPVSGFYDSRLPGVDVTEIDRVFFAQYAPRVTQAPLFAGVAELLRQLQKEGRGLFVLSTNAQNVLETAIEFHELGGIFREVIGGAASKYGALASLVDRHDLVRSRSFFVGDTTHDISAGASASLNSVAVSYGYFRADALALASPTHIVDSVTALGQVLNFEELEA